MILQDVFHSYVLPSCFVSSVLRPKAIVWGKSELCLGSEIGIRTTCIPSSTRDEYSNTTASHTASYPSGKKRVSTVGGGFWFQPQESQLASTPRLRHRMIYKEDMAH